MASLPEYNIRYRWTDLANSKYGTATSRTVSKGSFKASGATTRPIGKITRIVVKHYCSCTQHGYEYRSTVRLNWSGGSATSNSVNHQFNGDVYGYTNTISSGLPTPEKFATWSGITINMYTGAGNLSLLYWRANSDNPLDVTVYFYDAHDMCEGAAPPTVSGIDHADDAGLLDTFGNYVQSYSRPILTGKYTTDAANYPYLSAQHTLTLTNSSGDTLYTATQKDNAVFSVGAISVSGTIDWTYTVTDSAGNAPASMSGTFAVLPYAPPSIIPRVAGVDVAQRYATSVDDTGQPIYLAAADGDHVWFDLSAKVTPLAAQNAWTLSLAYGQGDPTEDAGKQIASGADGGSAAVATYTNDRSLVTEVISPASDYWFRFTIADKVSSASLIVFADKAAALFDVELDGAAVGMYSTATPDAPKFEVADTHKTFLYGGVESFGQGEARVNSLAALGIRAGTALPTTAEDGDIFLLYKA